MKESYNFSASSPIPEKFKVDNEDFDIVDNNILSELQRVYELLAAGKIYESDIRVIVDNLDIVKNSLFREHSFCASDIAQVLSLILQSAEHSIYRDIIVEPIKSFCENHLHEIGQMLSHSSMTNTEGFYDLVYTYTRVCDVESEECKQIFLDKIDTMIRQLSVPSTVHQMVTYLKVFTQEEIAEHGIDRRIDEVLMKSKPAEFASIVSAFLLLPADGYLYEHTANILFEKISSFGLDPLVVMDAWRKAEGSLSYRYDAIKQLCQLEERAPGCTSVLYKEFGVLDFHRYPFELLLGQYENRDNLNIPYGVILYPRSDGNGVFINESQNLFGSMYAQLQHIYSIRVCECDTKKDVVRMLLKLDQKYGAEHKIEFMIIGGHGTKDAVSFGGTHESHRLRLFDIKHEKTSGTKSFFEDNPSIILHSCETGKEGGVAEELSRMLHGKVIAPETKTMFQKINATTNEEGKPIFSVTFRDGPTKIYNEGVLES